MVLGQINLERREYITIFRIEKGCNIHVDDVVPTHGHDIIMHGRVHGANYRRMYPSHIAPQLHRPERHALQMEGAGRQAGVGS